MRAHNQRPIRIVPILVASVLGAIACTEKLTVGFEDSIPEEAGAPPSFVVDAGTDATDSNFELTNYCPTSKCTADRTTCPSSRFPCDVDLRSDPNNCGSCGFVCPKDANGATFACAEGKCQMACTTDGFLSRFDCNGIIDDGCEVLPNTNENCGGCGITCTDPAKPCVLRPKGGWGCGCPAGYILCDGQCLDPTQDDQNCGACGNVCDPTNGGAPSYPNAHYGCYGSKCGKLKCEVPFYDDCNHKNPDPVTGGDEDGCETLLWDNKNCGGCGNVCPDGQGCYLNTSSLHLECMCPPGKTLCGAGIVGICVDISNDPNNCGGCNTKCPPGGANMQSTLYPVCRYGNCGMDCRTGLANCNGNVDDGCEINTDSDPRNCGECGHECNAVAGQACIGGRCAVEPCDADAGEVVTQ